jgi:DNA (cytosine-5)-methyltransferase 1
MLSVGSLFAGIGGFDLGFERAGFEIRWQVEIDSWCRAVLAKHWPDVKRYADVRTVNGDLEPVDVVCGGFPCQPHSLAGRRAGADDERDLWPEFVRLIRELEPRWVVAENVPGLLSTDAGRFFGTVLGDLAACGYDAEWDCLPASAFGAPHRRDRVWIVAYSSVERRIQSAQSRCNEGPLQWFGNDRAHVADPVRRGCEKRPVSERQNGPAVSDATGRGGTGADVADADESGCVEQCRIFTVRPQQLAAQCRGGWESEPDVGRVAHGVPARVDRLRGLGNSIVPQIAEWIARRILDAERA